MRRYPVIYLLHGYGGRDDTFTTRLASFEESADRLAVAQGFSSAIVVTPNAFTPAQGQHVFELAHHRRLGAIRRRRSRRHTSTAITARSPTAKSRGLAGNSMGGYGALRIG
jgi:enterochelin esterase-like enzyme